MNEFVEFQGVMVQSHKNGVRSAMTQLVTAEKVIAISRIQALTKIISPAEVSRQNSGFSISVSGGAGESDVSYIYGITEEAYNRLKNELLNNKTVHAEEQEVVTVNNSIAGLEVNEAP